MHADPNHDWLHAHQWLNQGSVCSFAASTLTLAPHKHPHLHEHAGGQGEGEPR